MGTIACSRYNQGCNGGYPYLVGKTGFTIGFFEVKLSTFYNKKESC